MLDSILAYFKYYALLFTCGLAVLFAQPLQSSTQQEMCVGPKGTNCSSSIQRTIEQANPGDTIVVYPGEYRENIDLKAGVSLRSLEGPAVTTIRGDGSRPVVRAHSGAIQRTTVLEGFTITGGVNNYYGGGIDIRNASPTISNTIVTENYALNGGGIGVWYRPELEGRPNPLIANSVIVNNSSDSTGGGIEIRGAETMLTVTESKIENNSTGIQGGGIRTFKAGLHLSSSSVTGNRSGTTGGGVRVACANIASEIRIEGNEIFGNHTGRGGGIDVEDCLDADILIDGNSITNNTSTIDAAGIGLKNSNGSILNNKIDGNRHTLEGNSGQGGGIVINGDSTPVVANNQITNNIARCDAGGLGVYFGARPAVTNNDISHNSATGPGPCGVGGGIKIFAAGGVYRGNSIQYNTASTNGGGFILEISFTPTIDANFIAFNQATGPGGGILTQTGSDPSITNNFIIQNVSLGLKKPGRGDGIFSFDQGSRIVNNTIVGNGDGEGIHIRQARVGLQIQNNIITQFDVGITQPDRSGAAIIDYNNAFGNGLNYAANVVIGNNTINGPSKFVSPAELDFRLEAESAAIDRGTSTGAPSHDYYRTSRPINSGIDAGAHEAEVQHKPEAPDGGFDLTPQSYLPNMFNKAR